MTFRNVMVAILGLAAAFAIGVWAGPYVRDVGDRAAMVSSERADAEKPAQKAAARRAPVRPRVSEAPAATLAASEPDVHRHLKPLLNRGTKMKIASEGFRDAEQFAIVAHAAHNTKVPFMVLKHRVLNEGKSLADAIAESKPDVDAAAEAKRARAEARQGLAEVRQARTLADQSKAEG